jgi:hypothetical protein
MRKRSGIGFARLVPSCVGKKLSSFHRSADGSSTAPPHSSALGRHIWTRYSFDLRQPLDISRLPGNPRRSPVTGVRTPAAAHGRRLFGAVGEPVLRWPRRASYPVPARLPALVYGRMRCYHPRPNCLPRPGCRQATYEPAASSDRHGLRWHPLHRTLTRPPWNAEALRRDAFSGDPGTRSTSNEHYAND